MKKGALLGIGAIFWHTRWFCCKGFCGRILTTLWKPRASVSNTFLNHSKATRHKCGSASHNWVRQLFSNFDMKEEILKINRNLLEGRIVLSIKIWIHIISSKQISFSFLNLGTQNPEMEVIWYYAVFFTARIGSEGTCSSMSSPSSVLCVTKPMQRMKNYRENYRVRNNINNGGQILEMFSRTWVKKYSLQGIH